MSTVPSPSGEPVRRRDKTSEVVARSIVRLAQQQGLTAGARLPSEAEMISAYRVGRGTLREALRILEVNGFITLKYCQTTVCRA